MMDPEKRRTLLAIERESKRLDLADRGHQLLAVVADYIDAEDLVEARRVLGLIDDAYYDCAPPSGQVYLSAIARVVEVFGGDLRLFARPPGRA